MGAKIVVSAVSIILVVGVAIGVVVGVQKNSSHKEELSPQMKAAKAICSPTSYTEMCMQTLGSAANGSSDPKMLVKASIDVIVGLAQTGVNLSQSLLASNNDPLVKASLENCKKLYEDAQDNLEEALAIIKDSDLTNLTAQARDVQDYLNSVVAYAVTCMDEMRNSPGKQQIEAHGGNVTKVTDNALAILGELPSVFAALNVKLNVTSFQTGRRLLEDEVAAVSTDGFPSWFSVADRKLMGRGGRARRGDHRATAGIVPNAVVAQDGSGQFKTVAAALNAYPRGHKGRYVVYVKAGVYREKYLLTKEKVNVYLYGDGARRTIITNDKSVVRDKLGTSDTPTFAVEANGFIARDIGFANTAGPVGEQAVALRVRADFCAFFSVRVDGYQDSLYVHAGKQFYRNCVISGTVDFIFGDSKTIIQNSLIIIRKGRKGNQNTVTASGKDQLHETTGIVIHNCQIVPEQALAPVRFEVKSYLGRPWKKYATTVFMQTEIGDFIQPSGYLSWNGDNTGYFGEYDNRGPGANTRGRVNWRGFRIMNNADANRFTVQSHICHGYNWVAMAGIKYIAGLL